MAIWKGCAQLPEVMRRTVDGAVVHRSDELDELPGHAALHARPGGSFERLRGERRSHGGAVCADVEAVLERAAETAHEERAALVYDGCGFAERGFLERAEVVQPYAYPDVLGLFALDHWLTHSGGVSPDVAHTLVRALNREMFGLMPHAGQLLPYGDGVDALPGEPSELLFVGPDELAYESQDLLPREWVKIPLTPAPGRESLLRLTDSLASVYRRRVQEAPESPIAVPEEVRLSIVAMVDRRVRWATLVEVVEAAAGAGFGDVDIAVVTPRPPHLGVVRVASAMHVKPPVFGVHLTERGATVRCERDVTEVTDEEALVETVHACAWRGRVFLRITAAPGVASSRLWAAERLQTLKMAVPVEPWPGQAPPRDGPSRIEVMVRAGDLVVTCHDEDHAIADAALVSDTARCSGPESGWIDLQAEADVPVQRIVEIAAAGRRIGKQVALEPTPGMGPR